MSLRERGSREVMPPAYSFQRSASSVRMISFGTRVSFLVLRVFGESAPNTRRTKKETRVPKEIILTLEAERWKLYAGGMTSLEPRSLKDILDAMSSKDAKDVDLITRSYEFSREAHKEQKRYSGASYFTHPAEVGYLLADAGMDSKAIAA